MELRQGPDLSLVILVVDPYHSSWRIDSMQYQFDTLGKRLINALAGI
jgi:hypothetical protein